MPLQLDPSDVQARLFEEICSRLLRLLGRHDRCCFLHVVSRVQSDHGGALASICSYSFGLMMLRNPDRISQLCSKGNCFGNVKGRWTCIDCTRLASSSKCNIMIHASHISRPCQLNQLKKIHGNHSLRMRRVAAAPNGIADVHLVADRPTVSVAIEFVQPISAKTAKIQPKFEHIISSMSCGLPT